jgi:hypothetical protein
MTVTYRTERTGDLEVFYREAGSVDARVIVDWS